MVLDRADTGDVVDVRMGQQDQPNVNIQIANRCHQLVGLVSRIDDDRLPRSSRSPRRSRSCRKVRRRGLPESCGYNPINMIVCVVDDLIFSIKISTAAKRLGVDMYFERSKDNVLQTIRDKQPSLVIFDLNSGQAGADRRDRNDERRLRRWRRSARSATCRTWTRTRSSAPARPASIRCSPARPSRTSSVRS